MNRLFSAWQRWLTVLLLMLGCMNAHAEVYRWVDDQGRVHFDDRPPEKRPKKGVEEVKVRRGNVVDPVKIVPPSKEPAVEPPSEPASVAAPGSPQGKGGVVASQADCAAKKKAYEASTACYDACVQMACTPGGCFRNLSKCGHCTNLFMPRC
ncbi:MAG: DUF4124 domain-containing protein [Hydrogenophaga sp.]|nr:DUF4124 domain-containing protein [Hydrogenophaga sp.]